MNVRMIYDPIACILRNILTTDEFVEEEHPRGKGGKFAKTAGRNIAEHTEKNYGGSFNIKGEQPKSGYMVAMNPDRGKSYNLNKIKSAEQRVRKSTTLLNKFARDNADLLEDGTKYVGTWMDSETGDLWLDVSTNVEDKEKAIKHGKDLGELAIWDVVNGEEVRVNEEKRKW